MADTKTDAEKAEEAAAKKEAPSKAESTPLTDAERVQRDHDNEKKGN